MEQPFNISVTVKSTGETVVIEGKFPDDTWKLLLDFRREADRFRMTVGNCNNLKWSATLRFDQETGISTEIKDAPSDRDIAVILHRIRPFILQKERLYVPTIINSIQRCINHELIERILRPVKDLFKGKNFQNQIRISVGEDIINCDKTLGIWLNANEYHRDTQKQKIIDELNATFPEAMSRAIFIGMILDKAKAILLLHAHIEALYKRNGTTFKSRLAPPRTTT